MAWPKRVKLFFLKKLSWLLIEGIVATSRVTVEGEAAVRSLKKEGRPLIFIFWHRHILFVIHQFRNRGARPLISHSSDGELVAAVAEEFAMRPVRGSSSRGGARAFLELARLVREEEAEVLITADGPKGPARRVKEGALQLAAKTGAWIVPISWGSSRCRVLARSWDRFLVPLPFGRIRFLYGTPALIEPKMTETEMAGALAEWSRRLDDLEQQAGGSA